MQLFSFKIVDAEGQTILSGIVRCSGNDPALVFIQKQNHDFILGVPRQEMWIAQHLAELPGCTAIGVGGLLDFVSGRIPRAPLWMRKANIEWCFRLYCEPIRLFKRYIIGNPLFILRVFHSKLWRNK